VAEQIALLTGEEQAAALVAARQKQYRNKALDFYEPGSVFKTFTAAMGLEEGLVAENTMFYCGNSITVADRTIRCWIYPRGHGQISFRDAIANSCNPSFVNLGGKIGAKRFSKYYVGFGFTNRTGVDLLGEPSVSASLYYDPETMTPVNVAASSIGQTFKVTPLQMATALCAVANGGYLMQPYIVQQVLDGDGEVVSNTEPTVKRQVISTDTSKRLCAMLENAVSGGAIKNAYISGYRVGGKTGTAQKTETRPEDIKDEDKVKVIASFGGIAPADDPRVVVLVMIDEPSVKSGGTVAAPLAKKILKDILPYMGVEPNYTEEEIAGLDRSVPQVTGNKVSVAATTLGNASLSYKMVGKGDTVIRQIPQSGSTIPKGGTVWLYTDESTVQPATVPDFTGMTVAQVNQTAKAAGINVVLSGISTTGGVAAASQQSVTAGEQIPKGTVVTVEFAYKDSIF
jgi:stage V sporulation protein D (sporulation-specific penicillin-binding protein)